MNRKLAALMMVTALVLVALPAAPAAPTAAAQVDKVYLALGDSLAQGDGAPHPETTAYVPRLFDFFRGEGHTGMNTLVNLAKGGATSESFISDGQLAGAVETIETKDIGAVTLDIGGNDFLGLMQGDCVNPYSPECQAAIGNAMTSFVTHYPLIVGGLHDALVAKYPDNPPPLMVMTYYNPWSGTGSSFEPVVDQLLLGSDPGLNCSDVGVNDLIACMGRAAGADIVVDTYPSFEGKGLLLTHIAENNNVHPNNAGHKLIASLFEQAYLNR